MHCFRMVHSCTVPPAVILHAGEFLTPALTPSPGNSRAVSGVHGESHVLACMRGQCVGEHHVLFLLALGPWRKLNPPQML